MSGPEGWSSALQDAGGNPYVPVIAEAAREVYGDYVMYPCRPSTTPGFSVNQGFWSSGYSGLFGPTRI